MRSSPKLGGGSLDLCSIENLATQKRKNVAFELVQQYCQIPCIGNLSIIRTLEPLV